MSGFQFINLFPTRVLGGVLSKPASSVISAQIIAEMIEALDHTLRNALVIQSGALLLTLVLGLFSPRLGQVLYWMVYGGITIYSIKGIRTHWRLFVCMMDELSFTKGLSKEMQHRLIERSMIAAVATHFLVDVEKFCDSVAAQVWEEVRKPLLVSLGLMFANWLVVRIYLFSLLQ